MADIFDSYRLAGAWDEMFAQPGQPRPPYAALLAALQPLDPADLRFRSDQLARVFTDRGVTYDFAGEERPFPLDLIPRVIDAAEWDLIARGVRQRVLALEAFLADVYGPRHVFADGVLPWRAVCTSQHFHRAVAGLIPPNGVRIQVAGIDLVRDGAGQMLREAGLPARYVSGYLHPHPEAGIGQVTAGQSHAWVEYWVGSWVAADPTNQAPVGECHVIVARGRDYADVPPLKGIYHGAPSMAMDVTVEVTRLA